MAHTAIPQHITNLLTHLTSRPGVQSTFILSRKDGSIIQSTGLLAELRNGQQPSSPATVQTTTTAMTTEAPENEEGEEGSTSTPVATTAPQQQSYQPSHAETLAAHIFAFVSSASELSLTLSNPEDTKVNGHKSLDMNGEGEGEGEKEEDDEVKLLRLRTKKHEIVVVPDRKYLLCVVHDAGVGGRR